MCEFVPYIFFVLRPSFCRWLHHLRTWHRVKKLRPKVSKMQETTAQIVLLGWAPPTKTELPLRKKWSLTPSERPFGGGALSVTAASVSRVYHQINTPRPCTTRPTVLCAGNPCVCGIPGIYIHIYVVPISGCPCVLGFHGSKAISLTNIKYCKWTCLWKGTDSRLTHLVHTTTRQTCETPAFPCSIWCE